MGWRWFPPANNTGPFPGAVRRFRVLTHAPFGIGPRLDEVMSMTGVPPAPLIKVESALLSAGIMHKTRGRAGLFAVVFFIGRF